MCPFVSRVGTYEFTFTNERKRIFFEATFEGKSSSCIRLTEASVYTLSAALMSGLLFELIESKKCDWSTTEFDSTGWV